MAEQPLLQISALKTSVGTQVGLDSPLEVRAGEIIALTGPSGSGKSIFLRALAQLDPTEAFEASFLGKSFKEYSVPQWRSQVSYLPPTPALWGASLSEDFDRVLFLHSCGSRKCSKEDAQQLLQRLQADQLWEQNPLNFSTGERQRATLARLLWLSPSVLLLDEPTASLDPKTRELAAKLICEWAKERDDRAVLWITHDMDLASAYCNRYLQVVSGRVKETTKEDLA